MKESIWRGENAEADEEDVNAIVSYCSAIAKIGRLISSDKPCANNLIGQEQQLTASASPKRPSCAQLQKKASAMLKKLIPASQTGCIVKVTSCIGDC
eukprot:Em0020g596a